MTPIVLPELAPRREPVRPTGVSEAPTDDGGRDAMVDELIDSLPPEVFVEEAPEPGTHAPDAAETWSPHFTLEAARAKLGKEIEEALDTELKGSFREICRYRPSASVESERRQSTAEANSHDVPLEEEIDADGD